MSIKKVPFKHDHQKGDEYSTRISTHHQQQTTKIKKEQKRIIQSKTQTKTIYNDSTTKHLKKQQKKWFQIF